MRTEKIQTGKMIQNYYDIRKVGKIQPEKNTEKEIVR